ncbi:MAG: hypothetical protein COW18_02900 [Zetaproteobacteria bacterium CG12_big_fil_rev_8_21_14_0_65_54_13]|nr:MAG: hypothetical protein COW18_02900 [Zetaproteobacteria bacterium CG12_big_fil_rev_8_21_14_0_65_54_13]
MSLKLERGLDNHAVKCRACNSVKVRGMGRCRAYDLSNFGSEHLLKNFDPGSLYICDACGFGFRDPCLSEEKLLHLYKNMPEESWNDDPEERSDWKAFAELISEQFSDTQKVSILDVGANHGTFLDTLPETWDKYAIEPSKSGQSALKEKGVWILADEIMACPTDQSNKRFELICMFDVLEHLRDPVSALSRMSDLLTPGGLLVLSTGNIDAWSWKLLRGQYWYLDSFQHISFATPKFFRSFCSSHSIKLESIKRISHKEGSWSNTIDDLITALSFSMRLRGGAWRFPNRLVMSIPRYAGLRHKQ